MNSKTVFAVYSRITSPRDDNDYLVERMRQEYGDSCVTIDDDAKTVSVTKLISLNTDAAEVASAIEFDYKMRNNLLSEEELAAYTQVGRSVNLELDQLKQAHTEDVTIVVTEYAAGSDELKAAVSREGINERMQVMMLSILEKSGKVMAMPFWALSKVMEINNRRKDSGKDKDDDNYYEGF